MKFCFFNTTKSWGGGEKWHLEMAIACAEEGHSVVIVSSPKSVLSTKASEKGIPVRLITLSFLSFINPFKNSALYHFFLKEKFDAIILNSSKDLKIAAKIAHNAKIPKLIYRRGSAIPVKNSFLNRKNFSYLTHILANSESTKERILQNNASLFPKDKITIIYNGINIADFAAATSISNDVPVIGNLGRCVFQKGQDLLLQVAKLLKERNVNCRFRIGGDGALLNDLKKQSVQLGISEMVEFTGFVENPIDFLQSIDIFALSSRWEGFGYVIAEAMACQKPVVAFDISSNPELIVQKETGLLVPFPDITVFASAIEQLVSNKEWRAELGKKGKLRVAEIFNSAESIKKTIRFLES